MARLLLSSDLVFSPGATLTARVYFSQSADSNPELRVFWDHRTDAKGADGHVSRVRGLSSWSFRDPAFRTGWVKVQCQLGKARDFLKSAQLPDSPQYISFTAGQPEERIEVFIDDVELVDRGPSADERTPAAKTAPPKPGQKKEAPVAPPPTGAEKEPPVAPGPKKATPKGKEADALHEAL